ncbi:hypothetical protein AMATHDRAFT_135672 [Amanita thiersii Skay4041]|uniref:Vacuolar protein sorting-associated protein 54 C-terminal domain-containing protein n=1 Tax=Amanita thiersii Skay4041 TaxID=703135 RepID=A0A2A9NVK9_9AGAR|nr:hypothetical protein AMATHDRAFT_135672 [Amanita thiersii Skay4041]
MSVASSPPASPPVPPSALPDQLPTARPFRFTWDPSSRRPGPASVSGTTEGRGGDYITAKQPRLGFLESSSTTALASGALPVEWSSSRHGFNAISTVLNNPRKRQAPPKAHSTLPAVPPADLPRVRRKDFNPYLRSIAPEWQRYERNSLLGRDGQAQLDGGNITPRASLSSVPENPPLTPTAQRPFPTPIQSKTIPQLDSVPQVFFDQKFNLSDPRTFITVTEQDDSSLSGHSKSTNTNAAQDFSNGTLLLQDKLSHYADTVEQHLIKEISLRSTSFFAALTNLHDLQAESEQCLDRIGRMRQLLQDVNEQGAKRGLEIVRKECKLENVRRVQEGVKAVNSVVDMAGVAKGLVDAGQWGQALDVIEELERMWEEPREDDRKKKDAMGVKHMAQRRTAQNGNSMPSPLPSMAEEEAEEEENAKQQLQRRPIQEIPLSSLQAFSALPTHLRELTLEIAASLSSEVVGVLQVDLSERITRKGKNAIHCQRAERATNQNLRDRLTPLLHGLVRTKGLKETTLSWREVVLNEIKGVIKEKLPSFDAAIEDEGQADKSDIRTISAGLTKYLQTLSHADFLTLIRGVYQNLFDGIEGLQAQGHEFLDVLETIIGTPPDLSHLQDDFADIIGSAAELANVQVARVITLRVEQHAALSLPDFLAFFHDTWNFVIKCETICRRMIVGLRGAVVSQAKAFLQAFHQLRLTRSAKLVEDEQWSQTEVSSVLQRITETILDCAVRDSPELLIKPEDPLWTPPSSATLTSRDTSDSINGTFQATTVLESDSPKSPLGSHPTPGNNSNANAKYLRIEQRTYFIVSATAEVLVLLQDYLRLVVNLSLLTTDTMSRVIEFLKAFNSRTCQVVLGAGAMRSAGLKNITAKHLSLASQSLSIMFELIPYVREAFRRHLSPKQAVMLVEFDKLKRDFQEHQNEIHAKLIGIMSDRLNAHIKSLQSVDWNLPRPASGVNEYMEILVKETVTLHKVLTRYLATPTVEYVMTQVLAAINHRLSEEYGKIDMPHQEVKTRLLADAKYLHQKFSGLKHIGMPTSMLETVLAERRVPRAGETVQTPLSTLSSANQRLKGLLSGRSPTLDKAPPPPPGKEISPLSVPRTSSPGPVHGTSSVPNLASVASASVTSLMSSTGANVNGVESASTSTLVLVASGGGANDVVSHAPFPTDSAGTSSTVDGSSEIEEQHQASSGPGFLQVEAGVKNEPNLDPGENTAAHEANLNGVEASMAEKELPAVRDQVADDGSHFVNSSP